MNLLEILKDCRSIGIAGHIRPDGDCVGSCLGLWHYLKTVWPEKEIQVNLEYVPESLKILNGTEEICSDYDPQKSYEGFVALDSGDLERLGFAEPYFHRAEVQIVIDHHISNQCQGDYVLVKPDAAATCEILAGLMEEERITKEAAECLYLGIVHDTGVFKHSNTTEHTMCCAGRLISKGVNTAAIINESFYQKTYLQNQILGRCLLESFTALDGKVILSVISKNVMDFYEAQPKDLDGVIDQLNVTKGVEVSVFVYEYEYGEYKISMRSHDLVDVSRIARTFGGGGHVRAAGFSSHGNWHDILNNIMMHVSRQMNGES